MKLASPPSGTPRSEPRPRVTRPLSFSPTRPPGFGASYYGLGPGEAGLDHDAGEEEDDLTTRSLRALRASPEFQRYMRSRHLSSASLERTTARLHLYRQLRELDPTSFRRLVDGTPRSFQDVPPSIWHLGFQLLVSQALLSVLVLVTGLFWKVGWTWARATIVGLAWVGLVAVPWTSSKPCSAFLFPGKGFSPGCR